MENVDKNILHRATFLYDEATFLLKEELREPTKYELILEAISEGKTRVSEISQRTDIPVNNIPKYLRVLMGLGFINKEWPVILKGTRNINKGSIYTISDNFMKFWYTYIYPSRSLLEVNRNMIRSRISDSYNQYLGHVFEDISRQYLIHLNNTDKLPFAFERIGRQWGKVREQQNNKNTYEIDIVALNERSKDILFVECKWKTLTSKDVKIIVRNLREKASYVNWYNKERNEHFAVIAKTIENKDALKEKGLMLFDLDDVLFNH
jgi:AAA+ ATPase superfamily predicted ATPase